MSLPRKGTLPFMAQVTSVISVAPPFAASVNSTVFRAHLVIPVPFVDCAFAARGTFERSLHRGVLLERRPNEEIVPIADQRINGFGRRFDGDGALNDECVGSARSEGEQGHNENTDCDDNCQQHLIYPLSC